MIENYGLFWSREGVHWNYGRGGRGAYRGSLKGEIVRNRSAEVVDFREQVGIYCLYDNNFKLLYVGQAGFGNATLFDRLRAHTSNDLAERWTKFSWFGLKPVLFEQNNIPRLDAVPQLQVEVGQVLNSLEGILIIGAEPPLNRQGPKFGAAQNLLNTGTRSMCIRRFWIWCRISIKECFMETKKRGASDSLVGCEVSSQFGSVLDGMPCLRHPHQQY